MQTHFNVFGQPVELLVVSASTQGAFSIGRQTCRPGSGVPPHLHMHEDEVFTVVAGRFEIYDGNTDTWTEVPQAGTALAPRGQVHAFRNCGDTDGIIQFVASGSAFDIFLEGLSAFTMPQDVQAVVDYSAKYGIVYPTLPPPTDSVPLVASTA